ncbi:MAG: hypothetical protein KKA73_29050 [Chloroflexi bacterium]|nr:hypothetical protein [Chloroflexota bacterium]MBU1751743.1 hypothetical protein [Chloroflexota bacterium]MBU1879206.1 hypothetical protein [Chloroflexota bacterium]
MKEPWTKKRIAILVCRYVIPPIALLFLMVIGPLRVHGLFDSNCFEWAIRIVLSILVVGTSWGTSNVLDDAYDPVRVAERKSIFSGGLYISTPPKLMWILTAVLGLSGYYIGAVFWFTLAAFFGLPDLRLWSVVVGFVAASLSVAVIGWNYFKLYRFLYEDN